MEHNATASCPSSISVPWKKESALPFETSETFHQTIRRHISEHGGLNCLLTAKKLTVSLTFEITKGSPPRYHVSVFTQTVYRTNSLAKFPHNLSWNYARTMRTPHYLICSHSYVCWSNAIYLIVAWVLPLCVDLPMFQHTREASWKLQKFRQDRLYVMNLI